MIRLAAALAASVLSLGAAYAATAPAARAASLKPDASPTAGTSIGNAGVLDTSGSGTIAPGSDDWWVIYPATSGALVSVTVTNQGAAGSTCSNENDITANLWNTDATANNNTTINSLDVSPGTQQNLLGKSAASDRYYVEITTGHCTNDARMR